MITLIVLATFTVLCCVSITFAYIVRKMLFALVALGVAITLGTAAIRGAKAVHARIRTHRPEVIHTANRRMLSHRTIRA